MDNYGGKGRKRFIVGGSAEARKRLIHKMKQNNQIMKRNIGNF